jgi:hypothetical protein
VYGAVTTGTIWRFLKLEDIIVSIDQREYYINQVKTILAALLHLAGGTPVPTNVFQG